MIRLRILSVICLPLRGSRADGDGGEDRHGGDDVFGVVYLDNRSLQGVFHEEAAALAAGFTALIGPAARSGLEREGLRREVRDLRAALSEGGGRAAFERIVTRDPATLRALEVAARVAPASVPVLITGESGTGKELVARAVHAASDRGTDGRRQLRRPAAGAVRGGAVRRPPGRLHRRGPGPPRLVRARPGRHPVPGRDRRAAGEVPGEAPAGARRPGSTRPWGTPGSGAPTPG